MLSNIIIVQEKLFALTGLACGIVVYDAPGGWGGDELRWERREYKYIHTSTYINPSAYSGGGGVHLCVYCYTFCIFISAVCTYIPKILIVMQFNRISLRGNGARGGADAAVVLLFGWIFLSLGRGKTQ